MSRGKGMNGKARVFVVGHPRPTAAPADARYVRRFPDGSPMLAVSADDTPAAALARWEKAQEPKAPRKGAAKKEADDGR